MSPPSTAREALIAEAIGDLGRLLDRVEAVVPVLDGSLQALTDAGDVLSRQLEGLDSRMAAVTQTARTKVVEHVVSRINEAANQAQQLQTRAMAATARELFKIEVEQALQRLLASIEASSRPREHPWETWLTHAAAAAVASAATWAAIAWPGLR